MEDCHPEGVSRGGGLEERHPEGESRGGGMKTAVIRRVTLSEAKSLLERCFASLKLI